MIWPSASSGFFFPDGLLWHITANLSTCQFIDSGINIFYVHCLRLALSSARETNPALPDFWQRLAHPASGCTDLINVFFDTQPFYLGIKRCGLDIQKCGRTTGAAHPALAGG